MYFARPVAPEDGTGVPFCGCIEIKFNQNRFTKKLFFRFFTLIYPKVFQKTKNLKARIAYSDRYQNMKKANLHSTLCPGIKDIPVQFFRDQQF